MTSHAYNPISCRHIDKVPPVSEIISGVVGGV